MFHSEKGTNQSLLELHKFPTAKNDPCSCANLNEQVKYIRELGDHVTHLCVMGAPKSGTAGCL